MLKLIKIQRMDEHIMLSMLVVSLNADPVSV